VVPVSSGFSGSCLFSFPESDLADSEPLKFSESLTSFEGSDTDADSPSFVFCVSSLDTFPVCLTTTN
jgi:hypothetical protein